MNKKPIVVITGLAVAAVAGVAGLTRDQWMAPAPQNVAGTTAPETPAAPAAPAAETPVTTAEAPAKPAEQPAATAETTAQPASEQPAVTAEVPTPPAAEQPATPAEAPSQPAAATADAPAQPAAEQPATTAEAPAQPASETPAASAEAPAQPEATPPAATAEAPAQPATEQPAPTAEAPAQPQTEQPSATAEAPEQPAPTQPEATAEAPAESASQLPDTTAEAAPQPEVPKAASESEQQSAEAQPEAPAAAPSDAAVPAKEEVPAFDTVRVEKTGEAVIAGTAEAGSEVVVKLDGQQIAKTTANEDGAFVAIPEVPLPSGSGALTIESKGKGDLQSTQSDQSVAVIVPENPGQDALVAVVSPNQPTRVLQKPQPEPETQVAVAQPEAPAETPAAPEPKAEEVKVLPVSIDAVDYDTSGNIVFSGRGSPGHTARVYVDNQFAGDAAIDADGRWSYAGTADMKPGVHALRVDSVDPSGKVTNRVEVPFFREEQSKVAAAAPEAEQPADQTVAKTDAGAAQTTEPQAPAETEQQTAAATPEAQPEAATPPAQPEVVAPVKPREGRVVIQPGNNLWRISRVLYGSGQKYTLLYGANKDQIRDPDLIYPGQVFRTPDVAPVVETIDPHRREPLKPEENAASGQ